MCGSIISLNLSDCVYVSGCKCTCVFVEDGEEVSDLVISDFNFFAGNNQSACIGACCAMPSVGRYIFSYNRERVSRDCDKKRKNIS